jgi:glutamate/tyrosine decarboxylase-like PLP-dependent enzyme
MGNSLDTVLRGASPLAGAEPKDLRPPDAFTPSALFLGPNGENEHELTALVVGAIEQHAEVRRAYFASDPDAASPAVTGDDRRATFARIRDNLDVLTASLRSSVPVASHRNLSHMYWDTTLPATAGYIAAMLYNQNNCAAEGSPVTTALELRAGRELCAMMGYDMEARPAPWGHIAAGGTVANIEAAWAARNLKLLAPALARAVREGELPGAEGAIVRLPDGRTARLLDLSLWELQNLAVDEAVALPARIAVEHGLDPDAVAAALGRWSVQALGLVGFHRRVLAGAFEAPLMIVPATAHYSWPKAATLLGLGTASMALVPVDADARMDLAELRRVLDGCLERQQAVALVVAVTGTTQESAVDPLADIAAIRDDYAALGLTFSLHADAAWGGYYATLLRGAPPGRGAGGDGAAYGHDPAASLSPHSRRHLGALALTDTITVDPHKAGYVPYPAGAVCYRNGNMRRQIAMTAPVVDHDTGVASVGAFALEGSKPGAAAAAVALSHATIPLEAAHHGRLLARCVYAAKRISAALLAVARPEDPFRVTPLRRLPAEIAGRPEAEVEEERRMLVERVAGRADDELIEEMERDRRLRELFDAIGPDLNVCAYVITPHRPGAGPPSFARVAALQRAVFARLSVESAAEEGRIPDCPLIVTASEMDPSAYGQAYVDATARRAGLRPEPGRPLRYLISTIQDPFLTDTAEGNFIPTLMEALRGAVLEACEEVQGRPEGAA